MFHVIYATFNFFLKGAFSKKILIFQSKLGRSEVVMEYMWKYSAGKQRQKRNCSAWNCKQNPYHQTVSGKENEIRP
jgi:hypothetical protein